MRVRKRCAVRLALAVGLGLVAAVGRRVIVRFARGCLSAVPVEEDLPLLPPLPGLGVALVHQGPKCLLNRVLLRTRPRRLEVGRAWAVQGGNKGQSIVGLKAERTLQIASNARS